LKCSASTGRARSERSLIGQEIRTRLAKAMERFRRAKRVVFEMKHYQGLKLRAIWRRAGHHGRDRKKFALPRTRKLRQELGELR
jgi:RNA polymerase sigma-70 factor (ECF subfamily)